MVEWVPVLCILGVVLAVLVASVLAAVATAAVVEDHGLSVWGLPSQ